ncbi:MAG TPA: DUF4230 domain-containing protein [Candidatus Woesebacteria bacterium]|nr:DUF4230 domain-containing protein [Candidatus Woesebacteria bacterium]
MFTFRAKLIGGIVAIIIILICIGLILNRHLFERPNKINVNGANVVLEMQKLGNLETASYSIEKIVEAGQNGNVFQDLLFGDRILLIAHGKVIAGVNVSYITENNITITEDSLTITLPPPQILMSTLDNSKTRVYDRTKGYLTPGNTNLESEARLAAEQSILQGACEAGILQEARENAVEQITKLFELSGFTTVTVHIPEGTC